MITSATVLAPLDVVPLDSELASFSFDRVVVCQQAPLAAMLVANNFHFENNCAILSLDGYPVGTQETILKMARQNPDLQVFLVHDASVEGLESLARLRQNEWFSPRTMIFNLGLRPAQAWKLRLPSVVLQTFRLPDATLSSLSQREIRWLDSGRIAEIEALSPAQIMRAIYQGFALARKPAPTALTLSKAPAPVGLAGWLVGIPAFLPWTQRADLANDLEAERQKMDLDVDIGDGFTFNRDLDFAAADSFG